MSIYNCDEIDPEWEPSPWPMGAKAADQQEIGFHERATKPISWKQIPWNSFPDEGIFGHTREWLSSVDAAFYATIDAEDLLLIDNVWFGWPDPPRWGLASRPNGNNNGKWTQWGHFPELPQSWDVPEETKTPKSS
jgi:hypothetical protein